MANKQIYELNNAGNDLDNSALLAMDIPNPDSSAALEIPYVTRKASVNAIESQMLGVDEYTTELDTENHTIFGSINEVLTYAKNIAEEYDSTETYAVGDFCTYEGVLYKCIVAITVAEAWNSSHWDSTLIVEEFGSGGGASVTLGTTTPSDASGSNGDLYVQYDGTSYAAVFAYVKINNAWRKFPYAKVVALTRAEYTRITPDSQTLYIITDEQSSYVKKSMIASEYDSTATYAVGDECIYNDVVYSCKTAITVAEAWNASHWSATTLQPKTDNTLATTDKTVVGAINELKSGKQDSLSVTKESKSYSSGVAKSGSGLSLTTYGKVAEVSGYLNTNTNLSQNDTIASLGITPKEQFFFTGYISGGSFVGLQLDGSGNLKVQHSVNTNVWLNFSATFVLS